MVAVPAPIRRGRLWGESTHGLADSDVREVTLIERISDLRATSLPFAAPKPVAQTIESSLVLDVLQVLQGFPSYCLPWDHTGQRFYVGRGIHVSDLSQSSLHRILQQFSRAATSLRHVEFFVGRVLKDTTDSWLTPIAQAHPTLEAFANVVYMRLKCLRKAALEKELQAVAGTAGTSVTLLSLSANLSRVFAGAAFLEHVVDLAVPEADKLFGRSINAAELATHILSALYQELDAFCLLQDGEEDAYRTLLLLLVGSVRPMIESLDSWLQEGILSDPAGELFFYEDSSVPIDDSAFWETHYHLHNSSGFYEQDSKPTSPFHSPGSYRDASPYAPDSPGGGSRFASLQRFSGIPTDSASSHQGDALQDLVCPTFLKPLGKAILSAGKSLQLLQYARRERVEGEEDTVQVMYASSKIPSPFLPEGFCSLMSVPDEKDFSVFVASSGSGNDNSEIKASDNTNEEQPSLYEQFCSSLKELLGETSISKDCSEVKANLEAIGSNTPYHSYSQGCGSKGKLLDVLLGKRMWALGLFSYANMVKEDTVRSVHETAYRSSHSRTSSEVTEDVWTRESETGSATLNGTVVPEPDTKGTTCTVKGFGTAFVLSDKSKLPTNKVWKGQLNLADYCQVSALDDSQLRRSVFSSNAVEKVTTLQVDKVRDISVGEWKRHDGGVHSTIFRTQMDRSVESMSSSVTDFNYGLACGKLLLMHDQRDLRAIERLLPYPTMLPLFEEQSHVSEQLPSRSDNRKAESMLQWLQCATFKTALAPTVLFQECLTSSIKRQVDHVGHQLLARLMGEWRLMEELALLRAIYLVGSGDLLQQFASVLFNKLDQGEPWDDFYQLNTMLQESVRSSSHGVAIPALDSLVVNVLPRTASTHGGGSGSSTGSFHIGGRAPSFGIDTLDSLSFTYKVAWPLELIIDTNAVKKYNQVTIFLLKVKRAKHALDKACRWTWKNAVGDAAHHKQRLLLQQKLMHFVNTLHQYVMDRVLYSAWVDLCESMSTAESLDEIKTCHDAYLVSIQRQCFVAPDKLWTLIASRVKTILGLALNYHTVQRVLCDGVGAAAISARCQLEIQRIERQFDECMVFLMRVLSFRLHVGHFPHLADLVTRINYNYYYMTEDGQLSTPIPDALGMNSRRPTSRRI